MPSLCGCLTRQCACSCGFCPFLSGNCLTVCAHHYPHTGCCGAGCATRHPANAPLLQLAVTEVWPGDVIWCAWVRAKHTQLAPYWCQAAVPPLCHDALATCHGLSTCLCCAAHSGAPVYISRTRVVSVVAFIHPRGVAAKAGNACWGSVELPFLSLQLGLH